MKDNITRDFGTSEKAHARIHELEAQLGIPRSNDTEEICSAWDRLSILEDLAATKAPAPAPPSMQTQSIPPTAHTLPPISAGKPLIGLARAIAANQRNTHTV